MKRFFLIGITMVLFSQTKSFAQTDNLMKDDSLKSFCRYLMKNIRYPAVAKENNFQGKEIISLTLTQQSITNIKVVRSLLPQCDTEVVRKLENYNNTLHPTIKLMPGKYTLVIHFELGDDENLNISGFPNKLIAGNIIDMGIVGYSVVKRQSVN
ncbi:hypothetical protein BEL04_01750 [Mucilaginibacter sp. PPCGB 2223]|uniref:hypothetical protein n=1 Tax=Mucilaginibacter sp. PPCGB 2223 TaxID=1886027 RepID=UPI000826838B|nr:hypothetical protein [Mucilaginibacter sp. PPCGB 2223]OCX53065.1 hypothetical protein BEL04_01750 [Mucilaginibacter sp. PPCGB 2223]